MVSKLIAAVAATALMAAVPTVAAAQDDDGGISGVEALGVIFALVAAGILIWDDEGDPISP